MGKRKYILFALSICLLFTLTSCSLYRQDPLTGERSPNGKYDAIVTLDIRFNKYYRTYVMISPVVNKNSDKDNIIGSCLGNL
jgi:hypothetical protein